MIRTPIEQRLGELFADQEAFLDNHDSGVVDTLHTHRGRIERSNSRGRVAFVAAAAAVVLVAGAAFVTFDGSSSPVSSSLVDGENPFQALDGTRTPGAFAIVEQDVVFGSTSQVGISGEETDVFRVSASTGEIQDTSREYGGIMTSIAATSEHVVAVTSEGGWHVWDADDFGDEDRSGGNEYQNLLAAQVAAGDDRFWIQFEDGSFIEFIPGGSDGSNVGELMRGPAETVDFVVTGEGDPFAATSDGRIYRSGELVADLGVEVFGLVATNKGVVAVTADDGDGEIKHIDTDGDSQNRSFSLTDAGTPIGWAGNSDGSVVVVYDSGRVGIASDSVETFAEVLTGLPPAPSAAAVLQIGEQTVLIVTDQNGVLSTHLLPTK